MYRRLKGAVGFPEIECFMTHGDTHFMVTGLLGRSVQSLCVPMRPEFSLRTVLVLAVQLLSRLEYVHAKGIVHRDVKPDNFVMGVGQNASVVYMIDFGLARRPRRDRPADAERRFVGTPRFASIRAHDGLDPAPRDDLEGLAYSLVWLLRGSLPWQALEDDRDALAAIGRRKAGVTPGELCAGLPCEFAAFLESARALGPADAPDYAGYRRSFADALVARGLPFALDATTSLGGGRETASDPSLKCDAREDRRKVKLARKDRHSAGSAQTGK